MTYTAHTKEIPACLVENNVNARGHCGNIITIHPDYVSEFIDGKEYDESEFEIKTTQYYHLQDTVYESYAIPKQKEESQDQLWIEVLKMFGGFAPLFETELRKLKSTFFIKRK